MSENSSEAKALSMGLKEQLGPYGVKLAEHALEREYNEDQVEEILIKKWDGGVPASFQVGEASRQVMNILHLMLDFALEEATNRMDYSLSDEGWINYYVEPYYNDSSTVLVVHKKTKTLLYRDRRKTYHFDPEGVETFLEDMVEGICEGIDLVRKREPLSFLKDFLEDSLDIDYRVENDRNFALLYHLLGEPSTLGGRECSNCGRKVFDQGNISPEAVRVEYDLDHQHPDFWYFCSARCLLEKTGIVEGVKEWLNKLPLEEKTDILANLLKY